MCIAIQKPGGIDLPENVLRNSFRNNPDGAGFSVWFGPYDVTTMKGFFDFESFWRAWNEVMGYAAAQGSPNPPAMVHFRIATSGRTDVRNCHPFVFGPKDRYVLCHNGVLSYGSYGGYGSGYGYDSEPFEFRDSPRKSDTKFLVVDWLRPLAEEVKPNSLCQPKIREILGGMIEDSNKLIVLDALLGEFMIVNEKSGSWADVGSGKKRKKKGTALCWFSNDSWKPPQTSKVVGKRNASKRVYPTSTGTRTTYSPLGTPTIFDDGFPGGGDDRGYLDDRDYGDPGYNAIPYVTREEDNEEFLETFSVEELESLEKTDGLKDLGIPVGEIAEHVRRRRVEDELDRRFEDSFAGREDEGDDDDDDGEEWAGPAYRPDDLERLDEECLAFRFANDFGASPEAVDAFFHYVGADVVRLVLYCAPARIIRKLCVPPGEPGWAQKAAKETERLLLVEPPSRPWANVEIPGYRTRCLVPLFLPLMTLLRLGRFCLGAGEQRVLSERIEETAEVLRRPRKAPAPAGSFEEAAARIVDGWRPGE